MMSRSSTLYLLRFVLLLVPVLCAGAAQAEELAILSPTAGQRVQQLQTLPVVVRAPQPVNTRTISLSADGSVLHSLETPAPWQELRLSWEIGDRRPGVYSLRVSAVSAAGAKWYSPTVKVSVVEAPWYPAPRERSYALLIGVGQYQDNGITSLSYSVADVKAIYRVLTDPSHGAYPPENVVMLTDESPEERRPTRSNILDSLKNWLGKAGKDADNILVYFSGHGIEEDGRGYLVPRDARVGLLSDTGVDITRVNDLLQETGARVKLLVVDACHSAAGKSVRVTMPSAVATHLFSGGEGRVTLASCKEDQRSWEWPEKGQSVFTYYLVEALQGRADRNRDRSITSDEVNRYVHERVTEWATQNRRQQEPRLKADVSGEVVLAGMVPGRAPIRRPGAVAVAPSPAPRPQPATAAPAPAGAAAPNPPATAEPGPTWVNPKDGMEFVFVPAGPFTMGSNEGDANGKSAKPVHQVDLPGYWMGKCEVTVAQYRRFCQATGYQLSRDIQANGTDDRLPAVNISWDDAVAYCRWAGCRLPTEAEWEKAARGTDGRAYPWGNRWDPRWRPTQAFPVGSDPEDVSPYGYLDMAGNVKEWCSSIIKPYPYRADDGRESPSDDSGRVHRGGGFPYPNAQDNRRGGPAIVRSCGCEETLRESHFWVRVRP